MPKKSPSHLRFSGQLPPEMAKRLSNGLSDEDRQAPVQAFARLLTQRERAVVGRAA
jgi:hypothetical protein